MIRAALLRLLCSALPLTYVIAVIPSARAETESLTLNWKQLPPLPDRLGFAAPFAGVSGALVGHPVYLAGGLENPDATNALKTFWALDLNTSRAKWRELDPWPGPGRMLAVAGARDGAFYLFSGVEVTGDAAGKPVRRYL